MSIDDQDPRCPECGEPVSATAIYCMHCGADFEESDSSESRPSTFDDQTTGTKAQTGEETGPPKASTSPGDDGRDDGGGVFLDPDGLIDNSLTLVVGLVAGVLVGLLTFLLFALFTQSGWSIVPGGIAWFFGTGYLSTRRTVGEAIKYGCYAVALLLVLFPAIILTPVTDVETLSGRIFLFVAAELVLGVFGAVFAGIGYVVGGSGRLERLFR